MFGFLSGKKTDLQVFSLASELDDIFTSLFHGEDIPSAFVIEPYVRGFILGYSVAVMDLRFDALHWTKERRGKFQLNLYQKISFTRSCGFDHFLKDLDFSRQLASNPDFCEGRDHGNVCVVILHDKLRAGASDPLLENAQSMVNEHNIDLKAAIILESIGLFKIKWQDR